MPKYRKKPIVIEAVHFDGSDASTRAVCQFAPGTVLEVRDDRPTLTIHTLEGNMTALPGDWIIRGVKGEFYPCKPEIFAATYESVDPES